MHKDILMIIILLKITLQLNSIISTFKSDIQEVLDLFSQYGHLWEKVSSMIKCFNTYPQRYSQDYLPTEHYRKYFQEVHKEGNEKLGKCMLSSYLIHWDAFACCYYMTFWG